MEWPHFFKVQPGKTTVCLDISSTTYLLRLVNIVCERPLRLFCLVTQNNSFLTVHTVCTLKKCTSSSSSTYHCINLVLSIYLFLHPYCSSRKVVVTQSLSVVGLRKIQLRSSKSLHISRSKYKSRGDLTQSGFVNNVALCTNFLNFQ